MSLVDEDNASNYNLPQVNTVTHYPPLFFYAWARIVFSSAHHMLIQKCPLLSRCLLSAIPNGEHTRTIY